MKTELIILVNLGPVISESIARLLKGEFDKVKIRTSDNINGEIKNYLPVADYIIFDPVRGDDVDKRMLRIVTVNKKRDAKLAICTNSENHDKTADFVFEEIGIQRIIRRPVSWAKFKAVLFQKNK